MERLRIGVVGAGPAGAYAAWRAAEQGHESLLFDHRAPWEKPCGGGVTVKARDDFPWIEEIAPRGRAVREFRFRSPEGRELEFACPRETLIFARAELDEAIRNRAEESGARRIRRKVQSLEHRDGGGWRLEAQGEIYEVDVLVGADGAAGKTREVLRPDFPGYRRSIAAGFFIPAEIDRIETKFFPDARGYLWFFPRPDHLSIGLCLWGGDGGEETKGAATRERLLDLLERQYPELDPEAGKGYGAFIPTITNPVCWEVDRGGEDWALVGDAGGFVDAITGEGIYYALKSARAWGRALAAGAPDSYDHEWREEFGDELRKASELVHLYYRPRFIERVIRYGNGSAAIRRVLADVVMGRQSYVTLRRRLQREIVRSGLRRAFGWIPWIGRDTEPAGA
ncbi:MAG: NAD(P)/FAD-dependent oxidoreductase [Gemmatimonadota bacterium]|nr:NAD(P)/FAD-dependent oxidoreductase [Gemmatimonadota bacterium]